MNQTLQQQRLILNHTIACTVLDIRIEKEFAPYIPTICSNLASASVALEVYVDVEFRVTLDRKVCPSVIVRDKIVSEAQVITVLEQLKREIIQGLVPSPEWNWQFVEVKEFIIILHDGNEFLDKETPINCECLLRDAQGSAVFSQQF